MKSRVGEAPPKTKKPEASSGLYESSVMPIWPLTCF